jgi:hypothetical protein
MVKTAILVLNRDYEANDIAYNARTLLRRINKQNKQAPIDAARF